MSGSCWFGLGAFWRLLCRRLRAIKDENAGQVRVGNLLASSSSICIPDVQVKPVKPNVDYARFEVLVNQVEAEEAGIAVAVCGCRGWNSEAVNGIYHQDGTLNGCIRLKKSDGTRWLKFTDDQKWMVSRHPDGRPLGEAFTEPDETCPTNPKSLRGPWFVCSQEMKWEENCEISVTAAECAGCGKSLRRIHRCSKCRAVGYCGLPCQKADWRFHKRVCASPEHTSLEDVWEGTDKTTAPRSDVPPKEDSDFSVSRGMTDSHASDRSNWVPRRNSGSKQNWQELDFLTWTKQRLERLFEGPEEREGLPALHVECEGGGYVEVSGVKEIDGLASVWPNQGDRCHLFDLAFQVVFKACWLSDFAMMSMDGTVSFKDFTTNLVKDLDLKDSETEAFVCGMSVSFAPSSESNLDGPRTTAQTTIAPASRRAILEALGANARAIYRGHGLMHLVHLRLQRFADEFDTK